MNPNPRVAVVGTAGHIDHGKTALVRRLTGVNTDRLPEERKRGISIDLGFAPLVTPAGVRVGLVDVPGHERFVKNMLAGVGGVDAVLLVIAADEGVMPQTREHLAIVQLLQVRRGVIVLTKRDLVDDDWAAMVARDARELVRGTGLADAPIVECSAVTGAGCDALLATLDAQLAGLAERAGGEPARLPVDRVFTVEGFGTVVTGTLWRGRIATGDTLQLMPGGHDVRVRRVQVHGATVDAALAGQRTAVALHGIEKADVARGDWLVAAGSPGASRVLDVRFELLADAAREFRSESRVRFHLGASELLGRLVLLEGRTLAPGASALAQLRLESAAVAARGDRFVIRSWSPSRTIGGGVVIEPAGQRRRRAPAALAQLALHESGSLEARLLEKLAAAARLQSTAQLASAVGESEAASATALAALAAAGELVASGAGRWCALARWNEARERIVRAVADYADAHPARFGVMKGELKSGLKSALDAALFDAAFAALVADATLEQQGERVRPAGRPWEPPAQALAQLEQLERLLEADGYLVPENAQWQATLGAAGPEVASLGYFLGRLVRVSTELTYTRGQVERLRAGMNEWFAAHEALTVGDLRGFTGASRKYAVPLLEFADRTGWTVRVGDERRRGKLE
ncbi:MAG: selenocysteine-specific translation elongation factor [Candidatus Eisenbacteria bacterium]